MIYEVLNDGEYEKKLLRLISGAKRKITIVAYHVGGDTSVRRDLIESLKLAHSVGVEINVLLNGVFNNEKTTREVYRFADAISPYCDSALVGTTLKKDHRKIVIVDDRHILIGSHNLSERSLKKNRETSLYLESPEIASALIWEEKLK